MANKKSDGMSHPGEDYHNNQELGDKCNLRDQPLYSNDVKDGWIRGTGGLATGKPGYQHPRDGATGGGSGIGGGPKMTGGGDSGVGRLDKARRGTR